MPTLHRRLLIAILVTALAVVAGVLLVGGDDPEERPPPPAYQAVALADYDTSAVTILRTAFCDRLSEEAVADALGSESGSASDPEVVSWVNGERATVAGGVNDIAHEYGCRISGAGTEARAWVFAPPVTRSGARQLVASARGQDDCTQQPEAPTYGAPSVALVCGSGTRRFASYRGLFGDAWLACSVAAPARVTEADLLDRAGRFCVAVAEAARA